MDYKVKLQIDNKYVGDDITCTVIVDEEDIELLTLLDGKPIYVDEQYPDGRGLNGFVNSANIQVEELSAQEATILIRHMGRVLEGVNPLHYTEPLDMFTQVYDELLGNNIFGLVGDTDLDKIEEVTGCLSYLGVDSVTGRCNAEGYAGELQNILPMLEVARWEKKITDLGGVDSLGVNELKEFSELVKHSIHTNIND